MRATKGVAGAVTFLIVAALLAVAGPPARQAAVSGKPGEGDAAGFKEFFDRVQDYVKLRKTIEAALPPLKPREELPEMITAHQEALARKIRQARPHAERQDIFTSSSRPAFRQAVLSTFQGPQAASARATVRQGEPLAAMQLKVNEAYPDGVPHTSVPPTLLQKLPALPDDLKYCLVGRDLILYDMKANLVVDLLKEILP